VYNCNEFRFNPSGVLVDMNRLGLEPDGVRGVVYETLERTVGK